MKLAALILLFPGMGFATPSLLPFQGHLTAASGQAIADGPKVVQFKIYDAPVSGNAVWAGEVHKLSVNGGLVNTILGTKTSLSGVDFAESLYLEITVDADGSETITAADPPLLPRQVLLPSVFAVEAAEARELDGSDWSLILDFDEEGDPASGKLKPSVLQENSIPASSIVADNRIVKEQLADESVGTLEIVNGSIKEEDLEVELLRKLNPPGTIQAFAGTTPPDGWLMCDGSVVTQVEYPHLWDAIGTSHGTGGESEGDFNLPDYRGRFLRGTDDPDGPEGEEYAAAGLDPNASDAQRPAMAPNGNAGNRVGSVQADEFKEHAHRLWANRTFVGAGNVGFDHPDAQYRTDISITGRNSNASPAYVNSNAVGRKLMEVSGGPETRPKNANVNFIIKY
ncbi:tail fiber protein [Roseibacillus ishigakijimensis]|uniref:Tail fiber protein n=1 Tax=Roseibacillus ishigakijimensis TaxID=454146 RepID=A0A934RU41_9BACT|nr:tail fiber protein [Roseibacillus ishigakijimensis]MBK1835059.1 tail fiber protein [Roseibacillus ishigakijimensis]